MQPGDKLNGEADKLQCRVIFVPDIWTLMPNEAQWEKIKEEYKQYGESKALELEPPPPTPIADLEEEAAEMMDEELIPEAAEEKEKPPNEDEESSQDNQQESAAAKQSPEKAYILHRLILQPILIDFASIYFW